jgi:crossover junction endodeoxyribonuclease RusA
MLVTVAYPPSVNSMYRTFRGRMIISKVGRLWMAQAIKDIKAQSHGWFVTGPTQLIVRAWMPDNRRRDIDNLLKPLLDSMTHAGVWKDDCQVHDLRITRMAVDKVTPRCDMIAQAL